MVMDDWIYLVLLLLSVSFGFFIRKVENVRKKQLMCTVVGFILLFVISGIHILHPVILTTVNAIIVIFVNKRFCHVVSFVFCFSYLMFLRTSEYFGVPSPPEITNTAIMIMVLKMVGLAFEVNIPSSKPTELKNESDQLKEKYLRINPSFLDILQYSFCYAGILVGPYYKFRTYTDMFSKPYSTSVFHSSFLKKRITVVPLYISLYLISDYFFPLSLASSAEIWQFPFLYRVFYVWPWFFSFRMKIYVAFVLGECICINLGLGAYPEKSCTQPGAGPTNLNALQDIESEAKLLKTTTYNFETIRCMNEIASEFRPTIREGIRYWNMSVQYWLAIYIYRKTSASKPIKMIVTMFVSAIWHGVRPGYYLSLLGTPLLLISEIQTENAFRKHASDTQQKIYDFIWYFIKMQSISYMGVAFILLDIKAILHYWSSIYYIGHFFTVFIFMLAFVKNKYSKKSFNKDKKLPTELNKSKIS